MTKNMEFAVKKIVKKEEAPALLTWYIEALNCSHREYKDVHIDVCLEKLLKKMECAPLPEKIDEDQWSIPNTISSLTLLKKYDKV